MSGRLEPGGNGGGKGLVDVVPVCEGCVLLVANPQRPPPEGEMAGAIADVLKQWMLQNPVRVRETLPLVKGGGTPRPSSSGTTGPGLSRRRPRVAESRPRGRP